MSITGLFLMLFLLVHLFANSAYLFGPEAFDTIIIIMSSPVVVAIVPVLAAGFIIHIFYASYLTITNLMARGKERYAVAHKGGIRFMGFQKHVCARSYNFRLPYIPFDSFWAHMQLKDFTGREPENVNNLMQLTFSNIWIVILYLIWFFAIWFHLTHGLWSAFKTLGMNNSKWLKRWQVIAYIYATFIFLGFATIAITAYCRSKGIC
jgi:succinate dehydrogenase / fumarate reductase cytochrome b subunit